MGGKVECYPNVFIPWRDTFVKVFAKGINGSFNSFTKYFQYHNDEVYAYLGDFNDNKIDIVGFKIFTNKILFIIPKKNINTITNYDIQYFLREFKKEEEYDSIFIRDSLDESIKNSSLTLKYLSEILDLKDTEFPERRHCMELGVELIFKNEILSDYKLDNNLNHWSRYFKDSNPEFFSSYSKASKKFWGDNYKMIYEEINNQFSALSELPQGGKNKYINHHRTKDGTVNFYMLLVCHYNKSISLTKFKVLNYGRFELLEEKHSRKIFQLGNFEYHFNKEELILIKKCN